MSCHQNTKIQNKPAKYKKPVKAVKVDNIQNIDKF